MYSILRKCTKLPSTTGYTEFDKAIIYIYIFFFIIFFLLFFFQICNSTCLDTVAVSVTGKRRSSLERRLLSETKVTQAGRQVNEQYVQALLKKAVVQKNPKYKKQKAQKVNFPSAPIWLNSSLQQSNS